jgi:hypothetical protein
MAIFINVQIFLLRYKYLSIFVWNDNVCSFWGLIRQICRNNEELLNLLRLQLMYLIKEVKRLEWYIFLFRNRIILKILIFNFYIDNAYSSYYKILLFKKFNYIKFLNFKKNLKWQKKSLKKIHNLFNSFLLKRKLLNKLWIFFKDFSYMYENWIMLVNQNNCAFLNNYIEQNKFCFDNDLLKIKSKWIFLIKKKLYKNENLFYDCKIYLSKMI